MKLRRNFPWQRFIGDGVQLAAITRNFPMGMLPANSALTEPVQMIASVIGGTAGTLAGTAQQSAIWGAPAAASSAYNLLGFTAPTNLVAGTPGTVISTGSSQLAGTPNVNMSLSWGAQPAGFANAAVRVNVTCVAEFPDLATYQDAVWYGDLMPPIPSAERIAGNMTLSVSPLSNAACNVDGSNFVLPVGGETAIRLLKQHGLTIANQPTPDAFGPVQAVSNRASHVSVEILDCGRQSGIDLSGPYDCLFIMVAAIVTLVRSSGFSPIPPLQLVPLRSFVCLPAGMFAFGTQNANTTVAATTELPGCELWDQKDQYLSGFPAEIPPHTVALQLLTWRGIGNGLVSGWDVRPGLRFWYPR